MLAWDPLLTQKSGKEGTEVSRSHLGGGVRAAQERGQQSRQRTWSPRGSGTRARADGNTGIWQPGGAGAEAPSHRSDPVNHPDRAEIASGSAEEPESP